MDSVTSFSMLMTETKIKLAESAIRRLDTIEWYILRDMDRPNTELRHIDFIRETFMEFFEELKTALEIDAILEKIKNVKRSDVKIDKNVSLQNEMFSTVNETLEKFEETHSLTSNSRTTQTKIRLAETVIQSLNDIDIPGYYPSLQPDGMELWNLYLIQGDLVEFFEELTAALERLVKLRNNMIRREMI